MNPITNIISANHCFVNTRQRIVAALIVGCMRQLISLTKKVAKKNEAGIMALLGYLNPI
jgi:hypothetical protein